MRHTDQAICLRTMDYSETSQVLHMFTRERGVVHMLAKGSKRPKSKTGGAMDLMSEGQVVYSDTQRGALATLMEFSETDSRPALRRQADRLYTAMYMLELTGALLPEADPHPEVFDLLHNALSRLNQPDAPVQAVLAYFQWRLLRRAGLLGDLGACTSCGVDLPAPSQQSTGESGAMESRPVYFHSAQGGLLCGTCEGAVQDKYRLDVPTRLALEALARAESGRRTALSDDQARAANRLLHYHAEYQLGKPIRTSRYAIG